MPVLEGDDATRVHTDGDHPVVVLLLDVGSHSLGLDPTLGRVPEAVEALRIGNLLQERNGQPTGRSDRELLDRCIHLRALPEDYARNEQQRSANEDQPSHAARLVTEAHRMGDTGEVRTRNESTGGEKGVKLARMDLLPPDSLMRAAEHFGRGAQKYADRNWELGYEWSKSYGALLRHLMLWWDGEDTDEDESFGQFHHLDAVMFHALVLSRFAADHPELDDRPNGPNGQNTRPDGND